MIRQLLYWLRKRPEVHASPSVPQVEFTVDHWGDPPDFQRWSERYIKGQIYNEKISFMRRR